MRCDFTSAVDGSQRVQVMTINGARVALAPLSDLAPLRARITDAVISGGAFVDLETSRHVTMSFLVTPQSTVYLEDEADEDPLHEYAVASPVAFGDWCDEL